MTGFAKNKIACLLACGATSLLAVRPVSAQVKVACVGDSITAGYALANPWTESYPAQLQALLGSGYAVANFGVSGATLQKQSDYTYWNSWAHTDSQTYAPDIVVIMLGTNDTKSWNWKPANFDADYRELIALYKGLPSQPRIFICLSPPAFIPNDFGTTFSPDFIQNTLLPAIRTVADTTADVTLIDNNTPLLNQPALFTDGLHPSAQGAGVIASTVAAALLAPPAADQAPVKPTGPTAIPAYAAVSLSWNPTPAAESYTIKRAATATGTYTTIASGVTVTQFLDTDVAPATTYYYVVAATNSHGTSPDSTVSGAGAGAPPRAHYKFEGNAQDAGDNAFHGTANALTYVTGKVEAQAAQFNGSTGHVVIPRSITDDFTISLWIKTTDNAAWSGAQWWNGKGLVDGEIGGGGADFGTALVDGKFVLGVGSTGGDTTVASSANINDGAWHHVAATRDNTSGAMKVYVDGVQSGAGTGPTGSRTWPTTLRIGALRPGSNYFTGTLDDIRLYDRALGPGEVLGLLGTPPSAPTGFSVLGGDGSVALAWSSDPAATTYYIKRSTDGGVTYTTIATPSANTFTDTSVNNGTIYHYLVTAVNASGESPVSAAIAVTPNIDLLRAWRQEHFGSGDDSGDAADTADVDADGRPNLLEYALGSDPLVVDSASPTSVSTQPDGHLVLTFNRIADPTLTYEVWGGADLGAWGDAPVWSSSGTSNLAGPVDVTDPEPLAAHPRRFLRLRVSR